MPRELSITADVERKSPKPVVEDTEPKTDDDKVRVDMSEDDESEQPDESPRQEKRKSRWKEHTERTAQVEERNKALEEQNRLLMEQMQRSNHLGEQMLSRMDESRPKPKDELQAAREAALEKRKALQAEYNEARKAGAITEELYNRFQERNNAIEDEIRIADTKLAVRESMPRQDPNQAGVQAVLMRVHAQYPEVMTHPQAKDYSSLRYQQLLIAGYPVGWETLDKAMEDTRKEFKIQRPGQAQRQERRRELYTGPQRGGPQEQEDNDDAAVLDIHERRMARAFARGSKTKLDEKAAQRKFVREVKSS